MRRATGAERARAACPLQCCRLQKLTRPGPSNRPERF